jgi:hypothetical protein
LTYSPVEKVTARRKPLPLATVLWHVLADASEVTGFPRDNFEIHEISKEEFEGF